ncbi:MAG: hemolysin family protein [Clostridiales bacterium]|nr:hemolysin family protein [Clostridiales bacterium]
MDSDSISMIVALVLLCCGSAFFSATETAFNSLNKIRLKNRAEDGDRRAAETLALAEDYNKLLSGILIGNNIVNIVATTVATLLFTRFFFGYGPTISTIVMTVTVLIFGEVSPKTLAKQAPETVAMAVTPILRWILLILTPLTAFFSLWQSMLEKVFHSAGDDGITGEELITMVSEAENEGGLEADEGKLIRSAIEFGDLEVGEIFVPRVDMVAAEDTLTVLELDALFEESDFSRIPVYHENRDHILGLIHEKDFHKAKLSPDSNWRHLISPALYTTPSEQASDVLTKMQRAKIHMAVVVDEFGGTEGIITLEDILEELVGEIWDEHDEVVEVIKKQEDGSYLVSCSANLSDVFELLNIREDCDAATVSGWVIDELGHIPRVGDQFRYENLEVTVTAIRRMRVLEIRVTVLPEEDEEHN